MIVCAATNNAGKLKELRRILTRCGHEVKSLRELGVTLDPEETGTTFAENAKIKAEAFCKATGLPTVADDSGLCVDALNGAPGVYSARYAGEHGNDAANNEKLMAEIPGAGGTARRQVRFGGLPDPAGWAGAGCDRRMPRQCGPDPGGRYCQF